MRSLLDRSGLENCSIQLGKLCPFWEPHRPELWCSWCRRHQNFDDRSALRDCSVLRQTICDVWKPDEPEKWCRWCRSHRKPSTTELRLHDGSTAGPNSVGSLRGEAATVGQAQPVPVPNQLPHVTDLLMMDLIVRKQHGMKKYGVALQPNNGRDALQDAYEEAMDLCLYLRQALYERDHP